MRTYEEIQRDVKSGINMIEGTEFRATLRAITQTAANIVKQTLGPYASTTILDNGLDAYSTKDGWSVLENLSFSDPIYNVIYKYIRDISFTLNTKVGDGTTTALVVADYFVSEIDNLRKVYNMVRQADLIKIMDEAINNVIERLKSPEHLTMVRNTDDIYYLAYVSTNRNEELSNIIKMIYNDTNNNTNIHVALSDTEETYCSINRGYKLDCHLLWNQLYGEEFVMPNGADVYIFDHQVKFNEHFSIINHILMNADRRAREAVIFATGFDDMLLSTMGSSIKNVKGGIPRIALVQYPATNKALKNYMLDFSVLCETEIFNAVKVRMYNYLYNVENGQKMDNDEFNNLFDNPSTRDTNAVLNSCMGNANRLTLTKKFALLEEFSRETNLYNANLAIVEADYKELKAKVDKHSDTLDPDYMNAHLRYVKFIGNTGVIYVGGTSELQKKCLRDSVLDATLACRSAYENGFVRGFNIETLSVLSELYNESSNNALLQDIYLLLGKCLFMASTDVMLNKFLEDNNGQNLKEGYFPASAISGDLKNDFIIQIYHSLWNEEKAGYKNSLEYMVALILDKCITENQCYDIVDEAFTSKDKSCNTFRVINSVSTDIEILRAVSSIVTMLMSSSQLISINKRYDINDSKNRTLEAVRDNAVAQAEGFAKVFDPEKLIPLIKNPNSQN